MKTVFPNSEIPGRIHALQPFLSVGKIHGWLRVWSGHRGPAVSLGHLPARLHASARSAVYVVYSYGTPVGWVTESEDETGWGEHTYHVPDIGYSPTTGQHQAAVMDAWAHQLKRQGDYRRFPGRGRETVRVPGNAEAYGTARRARSGGIDGIRPGDVVGRRSAYEDTGEDASHAGPLSPRWTGHRAHP